MSQSRYLYDGNDLLGEYTGTGDPLASYDRVNGKLLARQMFGLHNLNDEGYMGSKLRTRGGLLFYHYDGTNNVTDITDHIGSQVLKYSYDAFGGLFTDTWAPYNSVGISGKTYDPKASLMDFSARWYSPATGRFTSKDTYIGVLNLPTTLNRYVYTSNNPLIYSDSSGHYWWCQYGDWSHAPPCDDPSHLVNIPEPGDSGSGSDSNSADGGNTSTGPTFEEILRGSVNLLASSAGYAPLSNYSQKPNSFLLAEWSKYLPYDLSKLTAVVSDFGTPNVYAPTNGVSITGTSGVGVGTAVGAGAATGIVINGSTSQSTADQQAVPYPVTITGEDVNPDKKVILFHGTSLSAGLSILSKGIDVTAGRGNVDFGQGYYLTTDLNQAREWADKKATQADEPFGVVLQYEVSEKELRAFKGRIFMEPDSEWEEYVTTYRTVPYAPQYFDYIEGPMLKNPGAVRTGAPYKSMGHQIAIISQPMATWLEAHYSGHVFTSALDGQE